MIQQMAHNSNRIMLKARNSYLLPQQETYLKFPFPFSGTITGESTSLSIDMGVASKRIGSTRYYYRPSILKKKF